MKNLVNSPNSYQLPFLNCDLQKFFFERSAQCAEISSFKIWHEGPHQRQFLPASPRATLYYYTTTHTTLHCSTYQYNGVRCLRKIQPLEVLLLLPCSLIVAIQRSYCCYLAVLLLLACSRCNYVKCYTHIYIDNYVKCYTHTRGTRRPIMKNLVHFADILIVFDSQFLVSLSLFS